MKSHLLAIILVSCASLYATKQAGQGAGPKASKNEAFLEEIMDYRNKICGTQAAIEKDIAARKTISAMEAIVDEAFKQANDADAFRNINGFYELCRNGDIKLPPALLNMAQKTSAHENKLVLEYRRYINDNAKKLGEDHYNQEYWLKKLMLFCHRFNKWTPVINN